MWLNKHFQRRMVRVALTAVAGIVAACGQTGALYLPTPPAGIHRASLPESLMPAATAPAPGTPAKPAKPASPPPGTP